MFSPLTRHKISRIIPFGLIWLTFSLVYCLLERGLLGKLDYYPATGNPYHFSQGILITTGTALISGLLVGFIEVVYLNRMFVQRSFMLKLGVKINIYCVIIVLFLSATTIVFNVTELHTNLSDTRVWNFFWLFFSDYSFWSVVVFIGSIIAVSLFYAEVSENLGVAVLNNFFTGKYHLPVVEERIFMFLDMKSSTTIAEKIGHVRYFTMLREYFRDISDPIIQFQGEIYQYVGDEVVISWPCEKGLKSNNCIECFFAMKDSLEKQRQKFEKAYGLLPDFKAGLHLGSVTTGEIGVFKKDIVFTGDVLNTTARIQSLCNEHKVDLLLSGQLIDLLTLPQQYNAVSLGQAELRGRGEKIALFTIAR